MPDYSDDQGLENQLAGIGQMTVNHKNVDDQEEQKVVGVVEGKFLIQIVVVLEIRQMEVCRSRNE